MIRFLTAAVVVLLAGVAAVVSYRHAFEVVVAHGESGFTAVLVPLTIDGLIFASSMVLLDAARRSAARPKLAYWTLGLGIAATLGANVAHGWAHGVIGAVVAAWPAVALVLSYELLMGLIRRSANPAWNPREVKAVAVPGTTTVVAAGTVEPDSPIGEKDHSDPVDVPAAPELSPAPTPILAPVPDELMPVAADRYADEIAEGKVPTLDRLKKELRVGQPRATRIRTYLGQLAEVSR